MSLFRLFVESRYGVLIVTTVVSILVGLAVGSSSGPLEGFMAGGFLYAIAVFYFGSISDLVERLDRSLAVDSQQSSPLPQSGVRLRSTTTRERVERGYRRLDLAFLCLFALSVPLGLTKSWKATLLMGLALLTVHAMTAVTRELLLARTSYSAAVTSNALELSWPNAIRVFPLGETVVRSCPRYGSLTQVDHGGQTYLLKLETEVERDLLAFLDSTKKLKAGGQR